MPVTLCGVILMEFNNLLASLRQDSLFGAVVRVPPRRPMKFSALVAVIVLACAACTASGQVVQTPATPPKDGSPAAAPASPAVAANYLIGPGDTLQIFV